MRSAPSASPTSGVARSVRSSLFAGSAVSLSLIAHVAGGGAAPPAFLVVALVVLMSAVASLLAGRQRGQLGIGTLMLLTQVSLHEAFSLFSSGSTQARSTGVPGHHLDHSVHAGMSHGMNSELATEAGTGMSLMTQPMLIWHALAALMLAILLSRGESALWFVLTWLLPQLPARFVAPQVVIAAVPIVWQSPIRPALDLLSGGVGRRGPPFALGAPA